MNRNISRREVRDMQHEEWLDVKEVAEYVGFKNHGSVWRAVRQKKMPQPVKLGERRTRWMKSEIMEFVGRRIAERDGAEGRHIRC